METETESFQPTEKIRNLLKEKFKKTGFSQFTHNELTIISEFTLNHPNEPIGFIAKGYNAWRNSDFFDASQHFIDAFNLADGKLEELKGFEVGITSWLPELTYGDCLEFQPEKDDVVFIKHAQNKNPKLVILSACDENYFLNYGESFLSLAEREYASFIVHLHVVYPSEETKSRLKTVSRENISISIEEGNAHPYKAYYASSRFLLAPRLLRSYDAGLLITDIDVFPMENFNFILSRLFDEDFDIACTKHDVAWMPWNTYVVTQLLVRNSGRSLRFFERFSYYLREVSKRRGGYKDIWWVDQNAMHFAMGHGIKKDNLKFQPLRHFGPLYLGPTLLGKKDFSSLCEDYIKATGQDWKSVQPIAHFLDKHRSHLLSEPKFLKRLLSDQPKPLKYDVYLADLLLTLHLWDKLPEPLHDYLLTSVLSRKSYGLALALLNKLRKLNKPFPFGTPNGIFHFDALSESNVIDHLAELLLRKGFDNALMALESEYQGTSPQTLEAFKIAPIRELIRLGATEEATETIKNAFSGTIMVVGLQRSGTNYVAELLRLNTDAYIPHTNDSTIFWKHCYATEKTPARVNPIFLNPIDALNRMDARCFVISKEPLSWIESVTQRNPVDFFTTRKQYVKNKEDIEGIAKFYRFFTESWKNVSENVTFISYEAVLENPKILFGTLTGIKPKAERIEIPSSVEYSRGFDNNQAERYLDKKTSLNDRNTELLKKILSDYL